MPDSHRYIGVIVISKIVISEFCPLHFTVTFAGTEFSSLYREYRYIEDCYIGVPLYNKSKNADSPCDDFLAEKDIDMLGEINSLVREEIEVWTRVAGYCQLKMKK